MLKRFNLAINKTRKIRHDFCCKTFFLRVFQPWGWTQPLGVEPNPWGLNLTPGGWTLCHVIVSILVWNFLSMRGRNRLPKQNGRMRIGRIGELFLDEHEPMKKYKMLSVNNEKSQLDLDDSRILHRRRTTFQTKISILHRVLFNVRFKEWECLLLFQISLCFSQFGFKFSKESNMH